jgi:hypothetical protein
MRANARRLGRPHAVQDIAGMLVAAGSWLHGRYLWPSLI